MDEFALIDAIRARLPGDAEGLLVANGDDAAVWRDRGHDLVLSVDVAVEGIHFRRDLLTLRQAGRRAFVAAASDLAAMGAEPRAALLSLVLPPSMADAEVLELVDGVADGARELAMAVAGGNVSGGGELSVTTTVIGAVDGPALLRSGALPGDGVFVTGTPGAAALGLALLLATPPPPPGEARPFVEAWRAPTAAIGTGRRLRGVATAAVDVSDGLLQDLGHLCEASGVGARVEAGALPRAPGFETFAARIGRSALDLALGGGEGYELLFTAPSHRVPADLGATRIGTIVPEPAIVVASEDGSPLSVASPGFRHRDPS